MSFSEDHIAKCKAAMTKSGPQEALRLLGSGRVTVEVTPGGDLLLDTLDGKRIRDHGRKIGIAGAWPLVVAGMVDRFGVVTQEGRELLAELGGVA